MLPRMWQSADGDADVLQQLLLHKADVDARNQHVRSCYLLLVQTFPCTLMPCAPDHMLHTPTEMTLDAMMPMDMAFVEFSVH